MPIANTDFLSSADIKARLSTLTAEELQALRNAYHYRWRTIWLRLTGWTNIFLGGITLWLGVTCPCGFTFPKLVQTLVGIFIVGQSLWVIVSPNTAGFLRYAILLFLVGIWNLLIAVNFGTFSGGLLSFFVGLLGADQLWWAFLTYKEYQRFRRMGLSQPQDDIVRFHDGVWRAITRGVLKNDGNNIQLRIGLGIVKTYGLLLEDKVVFALGGQLKLIFIQHKDDANFVPNSPNPMRKRRIYGRIKLNVIFERAMMKRNSFEKYALWKGQEEILSKIAPSLWQRLPYAIRIVLVIIGGAVLLYIAIITVGMIVFLIQYS